MRTKENYYLSKETYDEIVKYIKNVKEWQYISEQMIITNKVRIYHSEILNRFDIEVTINENFEKSIEIYIEKPTFIQKLRAKFNKEQKELNDFYYFLLELFKECIILKNQEINQKVQKVLKIV